MPKPVTPFVGCDVFITNALKMVLLIRRGDNRLWALPGGCHDLGETPALCATREAREETGYEVELENLMGIWSSNRYEYKHYPWKDNEFCHVMFQARIVGGSPRTSIESTEIKWFSEQELPSLSDGHDIRIRFGFEWLRSSKKQPYFE